MLGTAEKTLKKSCFCKIPNRHERVFLGRGGCGALVCSACFIDHPVCFAATGFCSMCVHTFNCFIAEVQWGPLLLMNRVSSGVALGSAEPTTIDRSLATAT